MRTLLVLTLVLGTRVCCSQQNWPYRIFFTTQSARIDTLPVLEENSADEIAPVTYTVVLDLNGDGLPETFVADGSLCGSGGCSWMIYDGRAGKKLGPVDGSIIYILKEKRNEFPLIETYWKLGGGQASVYSYVFAAGQYKKTASRALDEQEIEEYFDSRPPIRDEFKELK